jgi:hypothetical protein
LLGFPEKLCSGVFFAENAHKGAALDYTHRGNALVVLETTIRFKTHRNQPEKGAFWGGT